MKFEVSKSTFLGALQTASHIVPNKSTLQILNNFLLRVEGNFLEITSSDGDMGLSLKIEVEGHQDGGIVINARKLVDIVKELPDLPVRIKTDDYLVEIQSATGFSATLTGFDAMEFPAMPNIVPVSEFQVQSAELQFLSEKTMFAVSNDTSRPALLGVYCEHDDARMSFVATDGHRLGKAFIEHAGTTWPTGVTLTLKTLGFISKMSTPDLTLDVKIGEKLVSFATENMRLVAKLIEGVYPKYQNVIPEQFEKQFVINTAHFSGIVRRVSTMANPRTRQIKLKFENGELEVSARNQDIGGDSRETTAVQFDSPTPQFEIGFNSQYLQEVLKMSSNEEIRVRMNSAVGAVVIEPVGQESSFFFLLMPTRILEDA